MKYRKSENILSLRDAVSDVKVIRNGGEDGVSIARLKWTGDEVISIR